MINETITVNVKKVNPIISIYLASELKVKKSLSSDINANIIYKQEKIKTLGIINPKILF